MKVTKHQFITAFAAFADELVRCIPDESKFQRGLAGATMVGLTKKLSAYLDATCKDGKVDTDEIREYVDGAMRPCDGEIPYTMQFAVFGYEIAKPIVFKIRQEDADKFFDKTIPAIAEGMKAVESDEKTAIRPSATTHIP